jgi:hypothetical protein
VKPAVFTVEITSGRLPATLMPTGGGRFGAI